MAGLDPATQRARVCGRKRHCREILATSRAHTSCMPGGFVYMLASKRNGTLYTGVAGDLPGRVAAHREGRGSKFVEKYNVHRLVWYEYHELYTAAIQRETSIKRWKRAWKLALIERINPNWDDLLERWNG